MRFTRGEILKTMLMAVAVGALLCAMPGPTLSQGFGGMKGFGFGKWGGGKFGGGRGRYGSMRGFNNFNGKNRITDVAADLDDILDPNETLKPFATLKGMVFGEDGKTPASGITITIERQDSKGNYKTTSKENGKYTYDGLPAGEYVLGVIYKGDAGLLREATLRTGRLIESDFDLKEFVSMGKPGSFDELRKRMMDGGDGAEPDLKEKLSREAQDLYDQARDAAGKGDWATAIALLKKLTEIKPDEPLFWARLGESYMRLQKYQESSVAFKKAVELDGGRAVYNGNLAMALLFLDKIDEATVYTEKTAQLDPRQGAQAYYNLGLALTDKADSKNAEVSFDKSTKLDKGFADSYFQLGLTLLSTHQVPPLKITDAIEPLKEFIKLTPAASADDATKENLQTAKDLIAEISKPLTTGISASNNNKAAAPTTGTKAAPTGTKK